MATRYQLSHPLSLLAIAAAAGPSLLAYNVSPSPTFWNQALALALWGWFIVATLPRAGFAWRGAAPLLGALALVVLTVGWSWGPGVLPAGLALSAIGLLLASGVMVVGGAGAHSRPDATAVFVAFSIGWVVTGVVNVAIAMVQVFAPAWPDGDWIAASAIAGRAVGNLRQPNHLSSLLVWAMVSVLALAELRCLGRRVAAALFAAMIFGVVLSGSRTGLLSVLLLALWGLLDRRLSRPARALLLAGPVVCALAWWGMSEWSRLSAHTFGAAAHMAEADVSSSRFAIWSDTLQMIRQQPWAGVGFGEFNFAWTLTPFAHRPPAFFDHTHNLVLQLAVEIGLPLAALVLWLLGAALWRAARLSFGGAAGAGAAGQDANGARRCALMMVLMIGVHSMLEYPLWYSYFLLPAAWAWGFALGAGEPAAGVWRPSRATLAAALLVVAGAMVSVIDYSRVTAIFSAEEGAPPLAQRIARGQRSLFFAHHADYAAATTDAGRSQGLAPFRDATHYLLDTRLLLAWVKALARSGNLDGARYLAARLHEFHNPASAEFFKPCEDKGGHAASAPLQCRPPLQPHTWRDFEQR